MGTMINRRRTCLNYIEDIDYSTQYLTFVAKENGTFIFTPYNNNVISYSTDDGNNWTEGNSVEVSSGNKVMWKGTMTPSTSSTYGIGQFSDSTNSFNVQGNVMSLIYGDDFVGKTSLSGNMYVFHGLLRNTKVVNAKNLSLPATALGAHGYKFMFFNCTLLITAPKLPATTTTTACYYGMFANCTSLTTAPKLPAAKLSLLSYRLMFEGCTSLNNITCLATNISSASSCTYNWVKGVATSGTFIKAASMSNWARNINGIPSGWTVEDYTE